MGRKMKAFLRLNHSPVAFPHFSCFCKVLQWQRTKGRAGRVGEGVADLKGGMGEAALGIDAQQPTTQGDQSPSTTPVASHVPVHLPALPKAPGYITALATELALIIKRKTAETVSGVQNGERGPKR